MIDEPKYVITDATAQNYVLQNQYGDTIYEGVEHPLVDIFERLQRIEINLNTKDKK